MRAQPPLATLFALMALASTPHAAPTAERRFTVTDSIEMQRIVDPEPDGAFRFAPDKKHVLMVTVRGNLQTGSNDFSMWLYSTDAILTSLRSQVPTPPPRRLAQFSSSSNQPGIDDARWLADSRRVAFRAGTDSGPPQLYVCDTVTGQVQKLVAASGGVWSYDIAGDVVIYTTRATAAESASKTQRQPSVGLTNESLLAVLSPGSAPVRFVTRVRNLRSGQDLAVSEEPAALQPTTRGVWLSPNGHYAVAVRPYQHWSHTWTRYAFARAIRQLTASDIDTSQAPPPWIARFVLIDTRKGSLTTLIDAPTGELIEANPAPSALWAEDSNSVVLVNSLLPLNDANAPLTAGIIETDLAGSPPRRIAALDSYWSNARFTRVSSVDRPTNDTLTLHRASADGPLPAWSYRRSAGAWRRIERPSCTGEIALSIEESLNVAPDVVATACRGNLRARISDLNPSFRSLSSSTAEVVEWVDARGRAWKGGLLRPERVMPNQRYPLVIQTHGFWPSRFLLDGTHSLTAEPFTTGYAARALAARDMFVLQMEDHFDERNTPTEAEAHRAGFEAAVTELGVRLPIDPQRIGLMGFSRSAYYVQYTLAHSKLRFAAALLADPLDMGYMSYWLGWNQSGRGRRQEYEAMTGCAPVGNCLERWRKSQPTFNISAIESPVRLEVIGPASLLASWELYAGLRSLAKPVDMNYLPEGAHVLIRPWERFASQTGAVEWFERWLSRPAPAP